jgi:hypothetical protein
MARGRARTLKNGLTPKENAFKNKILEQIATTGTPNATQAAMDVYDVKNRATANAIAGDKLQKASIQEEIQKALENNGLSVELAAKEIGTIAQAQPRFITGDQKLKANIEILKLLGAYPGKNQGKKTINFNQTVVNLSFDEAKQKLEELNGGSTGFIKDSDS